MSVKKIGKAEVAKFEGGENIESVVFNAEHTSDKYSSKELMYSDVPKLKEKYSGDRYDDGDEEFIENLDMAAKRIMQEAENKPLRLAVYYYDYRTPLNHCLYRGNIYKFDRAGYSDDEIFLQIMNLEDGERRKFERLKHKFSAVKQEEKKPKRLPIPEEVRIVVWRRDEGKCSKCGSRENLEYDHIVPVSKGGSNTARNIELLCEKCNREKSANIC